VPRTGERARRIGAFLLQAEPEQVKLDRGRVVGPAGEVALSEIASTWYRFPQTFRPTCTRADLK